MTARPTVVEILGLPGSGKSTVTGELAARGTETRNTWVGPRRAPGIPVGVELTLRAPVLSALAYLTVATRRGAGRVHLRRVHSVQRRHLIVKAERAGGFVVLDEGPVHALFATLYGTRPTVSSRLLLRLVVARLARRVDRYVHLDVPKDRCIENFHRPGRTSARFNDASSPGAVQEFLADETYAEVLGVLRRVARDRLVAVDSVADAYEAVYAAAVTTSRPPPQDVVG